MLVFELTKICTMNYSNINQNPNCILLVNSKGKLRQLFVPFKIQCVEPIGTIIINTWVYVESVVEHPDYKIMYLIYNKWYPFNCFRITIYF